MMKEQNEFNKFWEDVEKAIRSMPKKPTMVIENPRLVGVRLNQELIDGLGAFDGGFVLSQDKMVTFKNDARPENLKAVSDFVLNYKG